MADEFGSIAQPEKGSPFWLNYIFLKFAGLWPPLSGARRYLYCTYTTFSFTTVVWLMVGEVGAIFHYWGDLDRITLLSGLLSAALCAVFKTVLFFFRFSRISNLVVAINSLMEKQTEESKNKPVLELLNESRSYAWKICCTLMSVGGTVTFLWATLPLIQQKFENTDEKILPLSLWLPYDAESVHSYETMYLLQIVAFFSLCLVLISIDLLFFTFMIYTTAQLKVLCANLSILGIIAEPKDTGEKELSTESKFRTGLHCQYFKLTEGKQHSTTFYDCVKHHQDIIRFVMEIEDIMNDIVLPQFLGDLLLVCLTLFQSMETSNVRMILGNFVLLLTVIFHLFLYCWHAQGLIEQSQEVALAAYSGNWIDKTQEFKDSLLILMVRSRKPLILTYGKISAISRGTFLAVMNASYSYYAILSQINKHKEAL